MSRPLILSDCFHYTVVLYRLNQKLHGEPVAGLIISPQQRSRPSSVVCTPWVLLFFRDNHLGSPKFEQQCDCYVMPLLSQSSTAGHQGVSCSSSHCSLSDLALATCTQLPNQEGDMRHTARLSSPNIWEKLDIKSRKFPSISSIFSRTLCTTCPSKCLRTTTLLSFCTLVLL